MDVAGVVVVIAVVEILSTECKNIPKVIPKDLCNYLIIRNWVTKLALTFVVYLSFYNSNNLEKV